MFYDKTPFVFCIGPVDNVDNLISGLNLHHISIQDRITLLSKLENVDAVLDGHTHLIYNTTTKDKNNKDIHISQTGTKLQSIGKLIIKNG